MPDQRAPSGNGTHASPQLGGLSIVIPVHNEEQGIGQVVSDLGAIAAGWSGMPYEIIVVDDGSTDGTEAVAAKLPVRLLRHEENLGYGAALKTGIRHATYDWICITDGDGTYPSDAIPGLLDTLTQGELDMVVAARTGGHVKIPTIRRPAKWIIGKLANAVAERRIPDVNSGLRIFRRATALQFFSILPNGFSFTTTITLAMLSNGYCVDYVPIDYFARVGSSKIRPIRDTLGFVHLILRIALYFAPLKIFLPMGGALLALALGWGCFTSLVLGRLADVSTLVIVMTSVQVSTVGLLAELVNRRLPGYCDESRPAPRPGSTDGRRIPIESPSDKSPA